MTIISLFSGAGGLDLGLIQAGNDVVWANDVDSDAVSTYKKNINGHIIQADIRNVDIREIPNAEVVVGGFPCQGFSMANMKRHIDDERNVLYKFFYNVISQKQPKFFIAENVKGILSLGKGTVVKQIKEDFENAGYMVEIHKVNMADYGVPQHRERVLFIGQRKDISTQMLFQFPKPTNSKDGKDGLPIWASIKDAIDDLPPIGELDKDPNNYGSAYRFIPRNFTAHRVTDPTKPSPTILARGNGKGGVCAIPHYNGERRLSIRESATVQTFPRDFVFCGRMGSCYRQIGNAVPVHFAKILGQELIRLERLTSK
jgi:DNA (cytosine-5)-methyltransferase 1